MMRWPLRTISAGLLLIVIHSFPASSQVPEGTWLLANNTISARVYRGTPLLGRTEILIRDPPLGSDAHCG